MLRRVLRFLRVLVWTLGPDPASWRWFRKLYGGHWERWWVEAGCNAAIWFEDHEHNERVPCGAWIACDDYPHPYPAEDAARRLGAPS